MAHSPLLTFPIRKKAILLVGKPVILPWGRDDLNKRINVIKMNEIYVKH
jgi:hypothetical protein